MGRSQTVHCLGFARMDDQSERVYLAMNRVEIAQMRIEAERDGYTIGHWIAQTKTGVRILGPKCDGVQCAVADADVPRARVVECSILQRARSQARLSVSSLSGCRNNCPQPLEEVADLAAR